MNRRLVGLQLTGEMSHQFEWKVCCSSSLHMGLGFNIAVIHSHEFSVGWWEIQKCPETFVANSGRVRKHFGTCPGGSVRSRAATHSARLTR